MRILFMGTPDFAVASLKRLVADGHDICGVFTQPDKPKNRGMKLIAAEKKMTQHKINSLLVTDDEGKLVGVIQIYDITL